MTERAVVDLKRGKGRWAREGDDSRICLIEGKGCAP